jgi:uncharacterized repeat protein (TIGR02543 family)
MSATNKTGGTLFAAWTRTVDFSLNGATIGSTPASQIWVERANGLELPSVGNSGIERRGFDHVGWSTSRNGAPVSSSAFIPQSANFTLYAAWKAQPTRKKLIIDFKAKSSKLTSKAIARLEALKVTLNPNANFPKAKIKIFIGSWRHRSQSATLGKKRIALVRKILKDSGIDAKFISSNDSRSAGSTRDAKNNRIELISEWKN